MYLLSAIMCCNINKKANTREHPKTRLRQRRSIKLICFVDAADPSESGCIMAVRSYIVILLCMYVCMQGVVGS